jgi:putative oxidoreductase
MLESLRFVPLLGRILIALLFVPFGFEKITGFQDTVGYAAAMGMPVASLAIVAAIVIEIGCGLMILFGYRTRAAAALLALFCVVTALVFHHSFADMGERINFLKNLAIAGGLLQLVYFGAGPISLDNRK